MATEKLSVTSWCLPEKLILDSVIVIVIVIAIVIITIIHYMAGKIMNAYT